MNSIVLALGSRPVNLLSDKIKDMTESVVIGDSVKVRKHLMQLKKVIGLL